VSPAGCCHRGESGGGGFRRGGSVLRPLRMHAIHPVRVIRTFRSGTSACAQNTAFSCERRPFSPRRSSAATHCSAARAPKVALRQ
jgi:hypothetical protein